MGQGVQIGIIGCKTTLQASGHMVQGPLFNSLGKGVRKGIMG